MLASHAVDTHSWNLSNYYLTMFHICRTIPRHFSLLQVKLGISQRKYKQKFYDPRKRDTNSKITLLLVIYYPTLLRRVQITRETSTNITRYLYSSHSPDRAKDQKRWQVRILGKRKRWIINLLLDILVCSIALYFYSSFVFWLVKIYSDTTH